jgi:hypothetical protein
MFLFALSLFSWKNMFPFFVKNFAFTPAGEAQIARWRGAA